MESPPVKTDSLLYPLYHAAKLSQPYLLAYLLKKNRYKSMSKKNRENVKKCVQAVQSNGHQK